MKAYCEDLRQRIVTAVIEGQSIMQVARRFSVSHTTVRRYVNQHQREGRLNPKPRPGRHRLLSGALQNAFEAQCRQNSLLTQADHAALFFEQQGILLSRATVGRYLQNLQRLGYSRKK